MIDITSDNISKRESLSEIIDIPNLDLPKETRKIKINKKGNGTD